MSPGDVILVSGTTASEVEEGDVITFAAAGDQRPTTHRVVEVVDQGSSRAFRTQGDNNENPDQSLVSPSEVQGKVMSVAGYLVVIPLVGYVIQFTSTPLGLVALLVAPLGLLAVSEMWQLLSGATGSSGDSESNSDNGGDDSAGDATESAVETPLKSDTTGTAASADSDQVEEVSEEEPDGTGSEATGEETGGVTFTAAELQLGLAVLFAFLAYSVWVTYVTLEVWAFAVAASVLAMFLLLGGLYLVGGEPEEEEEAETDDGGGDSDDSVAREMAGPSDGRTTGNELGSDGAGADPPRADRAGDLPITDAEATETEVGGDD